MEFLKELFGIKPSPKPTIEPDPIGEPSPYNQLMAKDKELRQAEYTTPSNDTAAKPVPEVVERYRRFYANKSLKSLEKLYFELLDEIQKEKKNGNTSKMIQHCQASYGLIEPFIQINLEEWGRFDIKGIPAIDESLRHFSSQGNIGQLKNIKDIVDYFDELSFMKARVDEAFERLNFLPKLESYVKANPMMWQGDIKKAFPDISPYSIDSELSFLSEQGKVKRVKNGRKVYYTSV